MNLKQIHQLYVPPQAPGEYIVYVRDGRSIQGNYDALDEVNGTITIGGEVIDITMVVSYKKPPPAP